jgi:hypothetical protein
LSEFEPHTDAAAILRDENDATAFQGLPKAAPGISVRSTKASFKIGDRR